MRAPAGWYPDPGNAALLRWWNGAMWADEWLTPTAPAGWYPAPEGGDGLRWFNGALWTDHATATSTRRAKEPTPTFAARAVGPALLGIAASVVGGQVLARLVFGHFGHSIDTAIAVQYLTIYAGLAATCVFATRKYGTGHLSTDFGWNVRLGDLWRGALVFVVGIVAEGIAYAPWANDRVVRRTSDVYQYSITHLPVLATVEFAIAGVIAAPLLEELVFRGLLQRALAGRVGVVGAVFAQALCFGAYHFSPDAGRYNVPRVLAAAAFALVAGFAAARWKRLGPGMAAHAAFNAIYVIAIATAR